MPVYTTSSVNPGYTATSAVTISFYSGLIGLGITDDTNAFTGGNVIFSGNNITLATSLDGVSQYIQMTGGGGGAISLSAGASSDDLASIVLSNANGVSFGLNGSTITGSVQTNYQSAGAYLTTAMQSICTSVFQFKSNTSLITSNAFPSANTTKFAGSGFTTTATAGTEFVGTLDSLGLKVGVPAYLTTAATGGGAGAALQGSGTYTQNSGTIQFANSNDITFGLTDNQMTASFSQSTHAHDYLLTANSSLLQHTSATSNITSNAINTSVSGSFQLTANNSLSLDTGYTTHTHQYQSTGNYLTTAMASDAGSLFIPIGNSTDYATSVLSNSFQTTGNYLTTAALSNHTHSNLYINTSVSGDFQLTSDNSLSLGTGYTTHTHEYQSTGNYLTTAAASDHGHSDLQSAGAYLTTAMASDAGSLYQSAGAYLTTAAASDHGHTEYLTTAMQSDAGSLYQSAGAYLTTAMASDAGSLFQSTGAYLTTGAASDHTHSNKAGTGTTVGVTNGTELKITLNSDGFNISVPAYITTYTPGAGGDWSCSTTDGAGITIVTGAATHTLSYGNFITTAAISNHTHSDLYQSTGAYLTTGAVSDHTHSDLYQSTGAYLTTAAESDHTHSDLYQSTGAYLTTGAASDHTHSDLYIPLAGSSAYQTATLANTFMDKSYSSAFQTATLAGTFMDKSYSSAFQTATLAGTFAQISNKAGVGTTIGATNGTLIKVTLNTDGLNISMPAYITTYAAAGGGDWAVATVAGTDMAITTGAATNTLYYPKYLTAAAGGGVAIVGSDATYSTGTVYISGNNITINSSLNGASQYIKLSGAVGGNLYYSDGSGVSWGSSVNGVSTTITASAGVSAGVSWALAGNNTSGTTASSAGASIYFSGGPGITLSGNSNTIVFSKQNQYISRLEPTPYVGVSRSVQFSSRSWVIFPFIIPQDISISYIRIPLTVNVAASTTLATASSTSLGFTRIEHWYAVLYTRGVGASINSIQYIYSNFVPFGHTWTLSHMSTNSGSEYTMGQTMSLPTEHGTSFTVRQENINTTATNISISQSWSSALTGFKYLDIPFETSLSAGNYWIGFNKSVSTAVAGSQASRFGSVVANGTMVLMSGANNPYGLFGQATNATNGSWLHGAGIWTTNVQGTTESINLAHVSTHGSHNAPYFIMNRYPC